MNVLRLSAFSRGWQRRHHPAGVAFCDAMPGDEEMLRIAREVGYSETAFLVKQGDGWRVRYFAPAMEVPFCLPGTLCIGGGETFDFCPAGS